MVYEMACKKYVDVSSLLTMYHLSILIVYVRNRTDFRTDKFSSIVIFWKIVLFTLSLG